MEIERNAERIEKMESALGYALDFLESLPSPPQFIIEEINNALEIEY